MAKKRKKNNRVPNISEYTYDTTGFQGYRLSILRKGYQFTRYFSAKEHGGSMEAAFEAACAMREQVFQDLKNDAPGVVFPKYRKESKK